MLLLFKLVAVPSSLRPGRPQQGCSRTRGRVGNRRVVGVLQSCAVVRTGGRNCNDGRRLFATLRVLHESIATAPGGMSFPTLARPALSFALVVWSRRAAACPTKFVARRWSPPSCLRAQRLRCCALVGSISTASSNSIGGGRRCPSNGFWRRRARSLFSGPSTWLGLRRRRRTRSTSRITGGIVRRQGFGDDSDTRRRSFRTKTQRGPAYRQRWENHASRMQAFAAPLAMASFATCASTPTGPSRRRLKCGGGRSDQVVVVRRPWGLSLYTGTTR